VPNLLAGAVAPILSSWPKSAALLAEKQHRLGAGRIWAARLVNSGVEFLSID
jgi:hypothetical protein